MSDLFVLKEYYIKYLKEVRELKVSSVNHYIDALNTISKLLVSEGQITNSIYEISDISHLEAIKTFLKNDNSFVELDKRGHQMYSSGLNNYYKFAIGEDFLGQKEKIKLLDTAIPKKDKTEVNSKKFGRSNIIKKQAIESADYICEIEEGHKTFISQSTGKQYMEGHHAIPMMKQNHFENSLDIYANIVCLCPICHRLLHYGLNTDKKVLIANIYSKRADRLANSGIVLSKSEFEDFALG